MPRVRWRSRLSRLLRSLADVVEPAPVGLDLDGAPAVWADHVRAAAARNRRESLRVTGTGARARRPGLGWPPPAAASHLASSAGPTADSPTGDGGGSRSARPVAEAGPLGALVRARFTASTERARPGRSRPTRESQRVDSTTPATPLVRPATRATITTPADSPVPVVSARTHGGSARAPLVRPARSAGEPPSEGRRVTADRGPDPWSAAGRPRSSAAAHPFSEAPLLDAPVYSGATRPRAVPVLPARAGGELKSRLVLPVPAPPAGETTAPRSSEPVRAAPPPWNRRSETLPTRATPGDRPSESGPQRPPDPHQAPIPLPAPAVPLESLWPDLPVRTRTTADSVPDLEITLTRLTRLAAEQAAT